MTNTGRGIRNRKLQRDPEKSIHYHYQVEIDFCIIRSSNVRNHIGHLRRPVTLTPIAERLAVELTLTVLRLRSVVAFSY